MKTVCPNCGLNTDLVVADDKLEPGRAYECRLCGKPFWLEIYSTSPPTPKRVIFLDIEGVLMVETDFGRRLSTTSVAVLSEIARRTDSQIVVTSYMKEIRGEKSVREFLHASGFKGRVAGFTEFHPGGRGVEINLYLSLHPEVYSYMVVDDNYVEGHSNRQILTDSKKGLGYEHLKPALDILR